LLKFPERNFFLRRLYANCEKPVQGRLLLLQYGIDGNSDSCLTQIIAALQKGKDCGKEVGCHKSDLCSRPYQIQAKPYK
jgi:hypothetical protein